jgi:hypothetical protein
MTGGQLMVPSASRLMGSLRSIGYDLSSAIADLVDNCLDAAATHIDVELVHAGHDSYVMIVDDGKGMRESELDEAMRYGSRRSYEGDALGHFGLGLKTASLSQCRRLTVVSTTSARRDPVSRRWDLDHVRETDQWLLEEPTPKDLPGAVLPRLRRRRGTVVIWESLDRVLEFRDADSGHARRALERAAVRISEHLGAVFHRFLDGSLDTTVEMRVNGELVRPWDPFARDEVKTRQLPVNHLPVMIGDHEGVVTLQGYILPHQRQFSSPDAHERASGANRWNRQQGLYIYRGDRLVQSGGWSRLRTADEHTKLARVALDLPEGAEHLFALDVAKMRVKLPDSMRVTLKEHVSAIANLAQEAYRRGSGGLEAQEPTPIAQDQAMMGDIWSGVSDVLQRELAGDPQLLDRVLVALANTAPREPGPPAAGEDRPSASADLGERSPTSTVVDD